MSIERQHDKIRACPSGHPRKKERIFLKNDPNSLHPACQAVKLLTGNIRNAEKGTEKVEKPLRPFWLFLPR